MQQPAYEGYLKYSCYLVDSFG